MTLANTSLAKNGLDSRAVQVPPSITRELANAAMSVEGLIPLWFGEPNQPTPKFICDEAARSLSAGETFYAEELGRPYLREAISKYMSNLYSVEIDVNRIAVTVSGGNALNLAFQSVLEEGDTVVTLTPAFPNLLSIPMLQGAQTLTHPLTVKDGKWSLDVEAFLETAKGAKVVLLNSPSNPTGFMLTREEIARIMEVLRERGTWLISDEVYARTVYDGSAAPSFLEVSEPEDRLIVVNSFSKTWAMTGWRLGWLTLPPSLTPIIEKIAEFSIASAPPFSQRAGVVALEQGEGFVRQMAEGYRHARDLICGGLLAHKGITCPIPESAFYAFFKVEGVTDSIGFARMLIEQAGVGLAPGDAFRVGEPGWFRLCFAQTDEQLNAALDRLSPFLEKAHKYA
ncbi:pyridoxal phosphate-dependent aminotransferase [Pseudovibrio sp. Tun.PSC04-5.I4]|uniref:pyridoxal phosphate-dependent aminotransferase n=1 Tax=Pseudovibrio sp. Tun.PSC04-5.I4 TaxID=1798213 RepID=UPI000890189B|nr:pyridoxal phosphate-dependent aminotransferase [Pseudovibrio sp. Tun.PSC04-5.I4]SDQ16424.1 Aspartate/methionine/tyrosine aminotransferase [Pseudovibrio sp. Tun.PSC04-5.I4]